MKVLLRGGFIFFGGVSCDRSIGPNILSKLLYVVWKVNNDTVGGGCFF